MAQGRSQRRALERNPHLAKLYEDYLMCRITQLVVFRVPANKKGGEKNVVVQWPQGFNLLPRQGGVDDQDYMTMRIFAAFLRGEQEGVGRNMSKG